MAAKRDVSDLTDGTEDNDAATSKNPENAKEEPPMKPNDEDDNPNPGSAPFIVRFYGEEHATDAEGRTLDDICAFDDDALEYHHDFIQVIFPASIA